MRPAARGVHVGGRGRAVLRGEGQHGLDGAPIVRIDGLHGEVGDRPAPVAAHLDFVLALLLRVVPQQIPHGFVVDFQERQLHGKLPAVVLQLDLVRADLLDGPGDQPAHDPHAGSLHGVGLAASRLAVGEQRDAVPVQGGLDKFRYLSEDGLLSGGGGEDAVEQKFVLLTVVVSFCLRC